MVIRLVEDLSKAGLLIAYPCGSERNLNYTSPLREFIARKGFNIHKGALRKGFFVNHPWNLGLCYLKGKRGEKTSGFRVGEWITEVGVQRTSALMGSLGTHLGTYHRPRILQ